MNRSSPIRLHRERGAGLLETLVVQRGNVEETARQGPLIVEEYDATTLVPPGCTAALDAAGNIIIEIDGEKK